MAVTERWGGLRIEPYKPNPKDADLDQIVQEGTIWERPRGTFIADELGNLLQEGAPWTAVVGIPSFGIDYGSISSGQLSGFIVFCIFLVGGGFASHIGKVHNTM